MVIEETYHGMRRDTFLPSAPIIPEEDKQYWKTEEEIESICEQMREVIKRKNSLPD